MFNRLDYLKGPYSYFQMECCLLYRVLGCIYFEEFLLFFTVNKRKHKQEVKVLEFFRQMTYKKKKIDRLGSWVSLCI